MQSPLQTFARIGTDRPGAEHNAAGNKGLQTKPSNSRFDLRRVNRSGSLNPVVRRFGES